MKSLIPILLLALLTISCTDPNQGAAVQEELTQLQAQVDSLQALATQHSHGPIATFLTFQNSDAEEAMNFYVSLFDNSKVLEVEKYGAEGPAKEGTILKAVFELNGSRFICSDSFIKHAWDFTPGVSIWVDCDSEQQQQTLFSALAEGGEVMMPLGNYGFSQRFGFVADRFGVSWQLNVQ